MTQTFSAGIRQSLDVAQDKIEYIARGAIQDVCELMSRRVEGLADGGAFIEGFVPVVSSELIQSQEVAINGGVVGQGDVSYVALISGMQVGDVIEAVYTAPHARRIEYGFSGEDKLGRTFNHPGRFFVLRAVQQWPTIFDMNVAPFKV
ncbi:hypothetical protein [Pseudooceanicola atlanticus]|uniref:Uncharacterized protein n=1 Tax=Pseudooceanicola atlanticus TaxID=1461694 RepID=A0A0A0EI69_9RHOB|nr:hypothetical protein [Pseudooceanicola atlanticus]KGM50661.1 hypothetical protein ATO9_04105 [Pseudooceanicola atlanticus]